MIFEYADFNNAAHYFGGPGRGHWDELEYIIDSLPPQFQPSDQAGRVGEAIFDPKRTNSILTAQAASLGWSKVPVPDELRPFGSDWDGGKGPVLAEWQFSNYPFLWNNVIRSEAIFQSGDVLPGLSGPVDALVIVTKSGRLPASNSTLYFEQARAQLDTVTALRVFSIPIRLVGLTVDSSATALEIDWNTYPGRYNRVASTQRQLMNVSWGGVRNYGHSTLRLS